LGRSGSRILWVSESIPPAIAGGYITDVGPRNRLHPLAIAGDTDPDGLWPIVGEFSCRAWTPKTPGTKPKTRFPSRAGFLSVSLLKILTTNRLISKRGVPTLEAPLLPRSHF